MPEARREEQQGSFLRTALQSVGIFLLIQFATKTLFGGGLNANQQASTAPSAVPEFEARPAGQPGDARSAIPQSIAPMWPTPASLDVAMYISPSLIMPSLKSMPSESLVFEEKGFGLGNFSDTREIDIEFAVPKEVQNNGTLWAHFFVSKAGAPLDPSAPNYDVSKAYHFFRPLTQHLPKKKIHKMKNLLSRGNATEQEAAVEEEAKGRVVSNYYHPNFTMSFIPDQGVQKYPQMHPALRQFTQLECTGARDASGQNGWYYPTLYLNTFWQLRDHMTELNSTVTRLPMHISLNNLANWKYSMLASIDEGMKLKAAEAQSGQISATGDGSEFEEFKRILLDSNVYLLATTGVVSVLHMIFEMMAFKNDVSHWRNKKDNVGTSFRTIIANVVMQTIIFLYLMDNNENTSWMILFSQGMGILIEAWKITKTVNVRVRPAPAGSWLPYHVKFEDKHVLSDTEKKTQEYDQIAFKYLYLVAIPLLGAYAVYSLLYDSHKSWYSFVITTLVGSVYAYGFLMMVPSLYINYRLKSVAHMPGKAMMYKFLNTFIDDLFAFTIKMPTLHRLATLRDDVIFFIYLYQSWKYKVDYSRVNEFGQGGDEEPVEESKKDSKAAAVEGVKSGEKTAKEGAVKATGKAGGEGRKRK